MPGVLGVVHFGPRFDTMAATIPQVAKAATVSLIDTRTNQTVATALTDAFGVFAFNFGSSFSPSDSVYILEAVKGLSDNRAGHSVVRLRTLIQFREGGWIGMTRGTFVINRMTTAITIIASLWGLDPLALLERVTPGNPSTFEDAGTGITQDDLTTVISLVDDALENDRDPVEAIMFAGESFSLKAGGGSLNPVIVEVLPNPMTTGALVRILGLYIADFGLRNAVQINEVSAPVIERGAGSITIRVPEDAVSGLLTLSNPVGVATYSVFIVPPIGGSYSPREDGGGVFRSPEPGETPIPGIIGGLALDGEFRHGYSDPAHVEATRAPAPDLAGDFSPKGESGTYTGPTPAPPPPLIGDYIPFPTPTP